ncbi:redox-sensing transcriptional repressor Rex [Saccharopolyspora halophila]|uniref:Redox-sensing transcriptional repressor Rex n=1 Tax=Saccharopolyspora halophila TaxID=405551 RepID=A0ABP5SEP9_9PSEU
MTAHGADVPDGDGQAAAGRGAASGAAASNGDQSIEVPAARERARSIPEAAVARLAVYLRALVSLADQEVRTVSSEELANAAGVNSAKLRKDLSYIGSYGTRGVGYEVDVLIGQIERTLGLTRKHSVAVVGIGNLGHALANYGGFPSRGFPVSALFDLDEDLVGVPVGGIPVSHVDDIVQVCTDREVTIGVIATPAKGAQEICDRLVAGGVQCILNFAPVALQVPDGVEVRKVDLAVEMQILSFHVARRQQDAAAPAVDGAGADPPGPDGQADGDARKAGDEMESANRMVERL